MIPRNRQILFALCAKVHSMKMISKYGNVIANARRGKSIFYSYLNIRRMQYAKAEYEYVFYMR